MPTETLEPPIGRALVLNPTFAAIVQMALRRRKLVGLSTAAMVCGAIVTALLLPALYKASAVILPPQQNSATSTALMAQLGSLGAAGAGGALGVKNPNDLQVSLLKSRTVEEAMVERFHLQAEYRKQYMSTTRKRWERETAIDNGLKDGLLRLTVTDRDPRRAAELANGWVEEYRRMTASLAVTEASQRRLFFERESNAARDELTRAEDDLKTTQERTGVLEIDGQAKAMIASAAMLRAQIAAKRVEIRAMREFAADQNPDLSRSEQELSSMEGQLATMDVGNDRSEGDLELPRGKITQAGLDYTRALREMKYREAMYALLIRQYEAARVDESRQGALVQVVDAAVTPDRPGSLYRIWILIAALVLALPLAVLMAAVVEAIDGVLAMRRRLGSWVAVLDGSTGPEAI